MSHLFPETTVFVVCCTRTHWLVCTVHSMRTWSIFMKQWASAWSCIADPCPSPQHRIIRLNLSLPASTRFLVYLHIIHTRQHHHFITSSVSFCVVLFNIYVWFKLLILLEHPGIVSYWYLYRHSPVLIFYTVRLGRRASAATGMITKKNK